MTFDDILTDVKDQLNGFLHSDWLGSLLVLIAVLIVTAACSRVLHAFLERILRSDKGVVPQATIFINIGRFVIWSIGICIILSTCFGVNVQAAITALGIGGIAISLGFQSTLSNLIGGLQIVLGGIIEPGDRIKISTYEGVVHDVTWRHTTIVDPEGETVVVPNSMINSSTLVKLHPQKDVRLALTIPIGKAASFSSADASAAEVAIASASGEQDANARSSSGASNPAAANTGLDTDGSTSGMAYGVDALTEYLEDVVDDAIRRIASLKQGAEIDVMGEGSKGYTALLSFVVNEGVDDGEIERTVANAIGDYATVEKGATVEPAIDKAEEPPVGKRLLKSIVRKEHSRRSDG